MVQNWWNCPGCQAYKEQQSWSCPQENQQWLWGRSVFYQGFTLSVEGTDYICMHMNMHLYSIPFLHWQRECPQVSIAWSVISDNFMKVPNKIQGECILWHPDLSPDNLTINDMRNVSGSNLEATSLSSIWITIWWHFEILHQHFWHLNSIILDNFWPRKMYCIPNLALLDVNPKTAGKYRGLESLSQAASFAGALWLGSEGGQISRITSISWNVWKRREALKLETSKLPPIVRCN